MLVCAWLGVRPLHRLNACADDDRRGRTDDFRSMRLHTERAHEGRIAAKSNFPKVRDGGSPNSCLNRTDPACSRRKRSDS